MKRLLLLRHAKSSWDDPALDDLERPLAPRGQKAARRLAAWLRTVDVRPELVLCSPALRARRTLEAIADGLGTPTVVVDERLYHASPQALLACVREIDDELDEALLVGHNPGLAELCLELARDSERRSRVAAKLPTGAFAILETDVAQWRAFGPRCAELAELVLPRELG